MRRRPSVAGGGDPGTGLSDPAYRHSRQSKTASRGLNEPAYRNSQNPIPQAAGSASPPIVQPTPYAVAGLAEGGCF